MRTAVQHLLLNIRLLKPNINIIKRSETHLEEEIDRMFKEAVETAELIEIRRD